MIINPYNIMSEKGKDSIGISKDKIIEENISFLVNNYNSVLERENYGDIKSILQNNILKRNQKISSADIEDIIDKVLNKILGYGILQKYIDDDVTTDIRVVSYNRIYIKKLGRWEMVADKFDNIDEFNDFVRYSVLKNGLNINREMPIVVVSDRRNHLRIEAGIDPANVRESSIVIRIHKDGEVKTLEALYIKDNMMNKKTYMFLKKAIKDLNNILIVGKGGSGKTTLLRAILQKLPEEMPICTNEETAELYLENRNVIQREVVIRKDENKSIDLEKLTRHSLVMSNDAIVIGELKGKEASTFFDAISTGHIGYTTIHADSVENSIDRLIVLIKKDIKAQGYTDMFLRRFISSSLDYIVYMENYKIKEIATLKYSEEKNKLDKKTIYIQNEEKETEYDF